jgi:hypothetical protein
MLVTRDPTKVTDLRTTDLRARLLEELKTSLKVRYIKYMGKRLFLMLAYRQAKDTLASTTIRVCYVGNRFNSHAK